MGCKDIWALKDVLPGLESVKPKLGPGNGHAHYYHSYFSHGGYVGACQLTWNVTKNVIGRIKADGDTINANVLEMWDRQDSLTDSRKTYFFFKDVASWLVFKTYLFTTPEELITDNGRSYRKPSIYLFNHYKKK
jgi:hypothetical protein